MCIHMQKDPIHTLNCPHLQGLILTTHPAPATVSGVNLIIEECTHVYMHVKVGKLFLFVHTALAD